MLLSELIRSKSDQDLEAVLRGLIAGRKAGSVTNVTIDQLQKTAGINGLTKSSLERFLNTHPGIAKHVSDFNDDTVELSDPSADDSSDEPMPEPAPAAEPATGDNMDSTDLGDFSLAPDAAEMPDTGVDLSAGTNTGAPMTPANRVTPNQSNGRMPHPQEYNQVQHAAQRALGRRS